MSSLEDVVGLVRRESGIVIKPAAYPTLAAAMTRIAPGWDVDRLMDAVLHPAGAELRERLIDEIAVKETFFFRHHDELAAVDWMTLWQAGRERGRDSLRVWSAACATGEESYTLAILACEAFGSASPPVSILGTDISRSALAFAGRGRYGSRAVRELSPVRFARWFQDSGGDQVVSPELRQLVKLRQHNLIRDPVPPVGEGPFDLIVCRNVLIYFERSTVHTLLGALDRTLSPGGALVIGAADRLSGPLGGSGARPHALRSSPALTRTLPVPRRGHRPRPSAPAPAPAVEAPADQPASKAVWATGAASLEEIAEQTGAVLDDDPLNVDAYFIKGVAQLAAGEPEGAVASLRRALYLQPEFGLAAFKLARAYEALHDTASARRAYRRALNSLRPDDPRQAVLLEQVDVGDIAMACRGRLAQLDDVR